MRAPPCPTLLESPEYDQALESPTFDLASYQAAEQPPARAVRLLPHLPGQDLLRHQPGHPGHHCGARPERQLHRREKAVKHSKNGGKASRRFFCSVFLCRLIGWSNPDSAPAPRRPSSYPNRAAKRTGPPQQPPPRPTTPRNSASLLPFFIVEHLHAVSVPVLIVYHTQSRGKSQPGKWAKKNSAKAISRRRPGQLPLAGPFYALRTVFCIKTSLRK